MRFLRADELAEEIVAHRLSDEAAVGGDRDGDEPGRDDRQR